jgi:GH25 family lysozyme M1 (1,4-beta-N-acetylmuramidase)
MATIVGNDISEFQNNTNWDTYKNNTNFVIIRATVGTARVDKNFVSNRTEARARGIPLGFYHYAYPQYNTPEAEADYVRSVMGDIRDGELIALDYEESWSGNVVDFCKRFLDKLSSSLNGYKPLIYLNQSLIKGYDWTPVVNGGYGLWVAAYTYDPNKNNFVTGAWKFAAMQQWTSSQQVPGLVGNVDGDVFFGDVATFKKYGYHSPVVVPPDDPCANVKQQLDVANQGLAKAKADLVALQTLTTKQLAQMSSDCQAKIQVIKDKIKVLGDSI